MGKFGKFARIAEVEFSDIVISTHDLGHKLRVYLKDRSFIDFFYTENLKKIRFSFHWERKHIVKTLYRLDNTPDKKWKSVKTFPIHFHDKLYQNVKKPPFALNPIRKFLTFASQKIQTKKT